MAIRRKQRGRLELLKNREKIEDLLKSYKSIKSNIEIELNKEYPEYSLDSVSFVKTTGNTNAVSSLVEDYVVDKYSLDDELIAKIQVFNIIKAALESLTREQYRIIKQLYFEDKVLVEVGAELGWSRWMIQRKRNKIIDKLKNVGILNAWEIHNENFT